jgi:PRC-barrel domain
MVRTLLLTAAFSGLLISNTLSQSTIGGGAGDTPKFVASQSADQLVFSKFKGADVIGLNDESIGGVNDLLFDKSGKILGVVVGVGGFLGIGQKNVAMDMGAFQIVPAGNRAATPAAGGRDDPTNIKLKVAWTKDQVQQAPDFQYYKPPADTAAGGAGTTGMGGKKSSPLAPLSPPPGTQ